MKYIALVLIWLGFGTAVVTVYLVAKSDEAVIGAFFGGMLAAIIASCFVKYLD